MENTPWFGVEPKVKLESNDDEFDTHGNSSNINLDEENVEEYHKRMKSLSRKDKLKAFRREFMTAKPSKKKKKFYKFLPTYLDDESIFECAFCSFNTNTMMMMRRHRLRHVADGVFNCTHCLYATKSRQDYKDHLVNHYKEFLSDSEDSDIEEIDEEEDTKDNVLTDCKTDVLVAAPEVQVFSKPMIPNLMGGLQGMVVNPNKQVAAEEVNVNRYEKILDLRCKYCSFFTKYRSVLKQHRAIHLAEGIMYCPQCDFSTCEKEEYKNHLMIHYNKDSLRCPYCDYITTGQYQFQSHLAKHSLKTYSCMQCHYTTGFKKAFKFHLLKHSQEKLLKCKHCPFITKYAHNYRQHMATHTGKGLMFCDFCSFYSAWETNFSRHLARHRMEEEARKIEEEARLEAESISEDSQ